MPVELQNASTQSGLPDAAAVSQWVQLTLDKVADEQTQHAELCIRYVDFDEGAALNAQFRQIDKATNVLSFPADLPPGATHANAAAPNDNVPMLLGDLVICAPVVAQEAQEQGKTLTAHTTHLVVHGVLHLLGHDHLTDHEAQAMERLEISLLAELGVANPYVQQAVPAPIPSPIKFKTQVCS